MHPILTAKHYPWADPSAQKMHAIMCELFPTATTAMFVARKAGIDPARIFSEQAGYLVWVQILDEAALTRRTPEVATIARDQNKNHPDSEFLTALLTADPAGGVKIVADYQPAGVDGTPVFLSATDQVGEPEALLFRDDLTLAIGRIPWLIGVLETLSKISASVCRFESSWLHSRKRGTGFRISDELLLTNWHVMHDKANKPATAASAEFFYDDDGKGGGIASTTATCDVASIQGDADDDWAVIRTTTPLDPSIPALSLAAFSEPVMGAPAFIVQHPGGERKRVAYVRNQITDFNDQVVHYLSDTRTGSSGSPVLDDSGKLVALHRIGGRPQEVAGKQPLRKNEGVRISRILKGLADRQIGVT